MEEQKIDKLQERNAKLEIEFFSQEVRDEFLAMAESHQYKSNLPKELLSLKRLLPIPHYARANTFETHNWRIKHHAPLFPLAAEDITVYREVVGTNSLVFHFKLQSFPHGNALKHLHANFAIKHIKLSQDISGLPFHKHDGRICFINKRCRHQFDDSEVSIHNGKFTNSIASKDTPHPVFEVKKAIQHLFKANPDRTAFEIQFSYIRLISKCTFWRAGAGMYEAKTKYNFCNDLANYAGKRLHVFVEFLEEGSILNPKGNGEKYDQILNSDWKIICRDFLKIEESLEP